MTNKILRSFWLALLMATGLASGTARAQYSQSAFDMKRASDLYDSRGYTSGKGISVDGHLIVSTANGSVSYSYPISSSQIGGHPMDVTLNYCGAVSFTTFGKYQQSTHPAGGTYGAGGLYSGWEKFQQNRPAYVLGVNGFAVNVISTTSAYHCDSASRVFKPGLTSFNDADLVQAIEGYDYNNRMYDFGAVGASPNGGPNYVDEISLLRADGSLLRLMNVQGQGANVTDPDQRPELYTGYYYPNQANDRGFAYVERDSTYWTETLKLCTSARRDTIRDTIRYHLPWRGLNFDSIVYVDTIVYRFLPAASAWPLMPRKLHYYPGDGLEYVFREVRAPYGMGAYRDLASRGGGYWGGPTIFYLEEIRSSAGPITTFSRARHYPIFGNPMFEDREDTTRGRALITSFAGHQLSFDYNALLIEGMGRTTRVVFDTIARSGNAGPNEMMPFANNGGITPASLALATYSETNPALYKSFVGYVTRIVDPEGRVTSFEYEPVTRTYRNMGFPRAPYGPENIDLALKNYRLTAINEPTARYVLKYYGATSDTITSSTVMAQDGPLAMNDVVDSVLKTDLEGIPLTAMKYRFQYDASQSNFVEQSQVETLDRVTGLSTTTVYDYHQNQLPNLAPLLPPARYTELYRVRSVAGDLTTVTETTTTTDRSSTTTNRFGTSYPINATSLPTPYMILPSTSITTINGVVKNRVSYSYTLDTVRSYGGDKTLTGLFGYEVTTQVQKMLAPSAPGTVLLTDTVRYLHLPYVDSVMTWTEHVWDKLATIQNFLHYRNDLLDPRMINDPHNPNKDQKLWEYWMMRDPIAQFTDVTKTELVHVPPLFGLESYSSTSDNTGVIAGKINSYRTQLRSGTDRFVRGQLLADTILGAGAVRLPGSVYEWDGGFMTGVTNALGARTVYGYDYVFTNYTDVGLPISMSEHPTGTILSNDSTTSVVELQTTAFERLYNKPGAERHYNRRYDYDSIGVLYTDSLTTYAERGFYGQPTGTVDANGWYSRYEYDRLGRLLTAWMPGDFAHQGQLDTVAYRGTEVLDLYGYTAYHHRADQLHCQKDQTSGNVSSTIDTGMVVTTTREDTLYASRPVTSYPTCPCKVDSAMPAKGGDRQILVSCDQYYPFNENAGFDGFYSVLTYPVDATSPLRTATVIDSASLEVMISAIDGECAELEVKIPGTSFLKTYLLRCPDGDGGGLEPPKDRAKKRDRPEIQSDHVTPMAGGYLLHVDLSGVAGALKTIAGGIVRIEMRAKTVGTTIQFANGLNGSDVRPRITIHGQYKRLWDGADYTLAYRHDDASLASEIAAKVDDIHHTANTYDLVASHGEAIRRTKSTHRFGPDYRLLVSRDSIFDAAGFVRIDSTHASYDGGGAALTAWDREGDSVRTTRDGAGRPMRTIHPDGTRDSVSYEITSSAPSTQEFYGFVRKVITVDERGVRDAQYFDAFDRLRYEVADIDSIAAITKYEYDLAGRLTQVENPKHQITTYTYDGFGRIKAKQMPDIGMVSYTYDKLGNVRFAQNAEQARHNALTFNEYDDLNRITLIGEALIERSEGSCPVFCEDSLYWECTPPADSLGGRLTEKLDPDLLHVDGYDISHITANPTIGMFPNNVPKMFVQGPLMQGFISNCTLPKSILLGETSAPVGPSVLHWTVPYYDCPTPAPENRFEDMQLYSRFARIGISYDKFPVPGRSLWATMPPKATWDALAPTGAVRNLKGHEAAVAYRERGSEPWHYNVLSYDERDRVEAILRATENLGFDAVYYTYNAMNQVTSVTVADPMRSFTTWYGYNRQGQVDSVWTKLGTPGTGLVPLAQMPPLNQPRRPLTVVQRPAPLQRVANQQADIVYSYTKSGQVAQMIYPPVNAYVEYAYNHRKWLDSLVAHTGANPSANLLFKEVLSYDPSGQITQQRYKHGGSPEKVQEYAYDSLDRLTRWTQNNGADKTSYEYDAVGNRTKMSESFVTFPDNYAVTGGKNQLSGRRRRDSVNGDTVMNYLYNGNGAMSYREVFIDSVTSSRPGHENMKTGLRFKEEDRYSYRGLLNRVFRTDSNNRASDWRYRYSASGEREQKRMIYTSAWDSVLPYPWVYYALGGSSEQYAVYHGQQTSGTGMCGDTGRRVYMYPAEYLTHGIGYTGTHEDIAQVITDANGGKQFRISDHLASLRATIDAGGTTNYDYDPWGAPLPVVAPLPSRRGYNDREKDGETGSYNLGVREMDDRTGFWSVDPLWQQSPSQSPYVYANANPLRMTDPKGMQAGEIFKGVLKGFFVDGPLGIVQAAVDEGIFMMCPICYFTQQAIDALDPNNLIRRAQNLKDLYNEVSKDPFRMGEFGGKIGFDLLFYKKVSGLATATADAGAAEALEGPSSSLAPGGGLQAHEGAGGHLIREHVGRTEAQLADRIAQSANRRRPLQAASTFVDRAEAEVAVSKAMEFYDNTIAQWVASGAQKRLVFDAPFSGGMVLRSGATSTVPGTSMKMVLQGNGSGGFFILTGYPLP